MKISLSDSGRPINVQIFVRLVPETGGHILAKINSLSFP